MKQFKQKAHIYEFNQLMSAKQRHTKMDNLNYSKLEIQEYFKLENMNTAGAQTLFKYRVRMANFSENFRGNQGPASCPLCGDHLDSQQMSFENCQTVKDNVNIFDKYEKIFSLNVPGGLVKCLQEIDNFREEAAKK